MARRRHVEGPCCICGTHAPLSWEHVPPESAFNSYPVVRASREQIRSPGSWDGEQGETLQRGSGAYTLCRRILHLRSHLPRPIDFSQEHDEEPQKLWVPVLWW